MRSTAIHRLINATQGYDWGSERDIHRLLGTQADGQKIAEVWMGTHPLGPSMVAVADGKTRSLEDVAGALPFMVKILAADRPLSLQVHPTKAQAEIGYKTEESRGIPLDAAHRSYKDPHHKPEMAYALTTFDTLVGFRPTAEILRVLTPIDIALTRRLVDELESDPGFAGIVRLVEHILTDGAVTTAEIEALIDRCRELVGLGLDIKRAYATAIDISEHFPDDPGLVVSLLLNRITLQPGEAAFLGPGVIHAHLRGMCIEVMASSDTVLRAGLTAKHINTEALIQSLGMGMSRVARVMPAHVRSTEVFSPEVDEFLLAVTQCSRGETGGTRLLGKGSSQIVVCSGGEVTLTSEAGESLHLSRGESVYAAAAEGTLTITGSGEVAQVFQPTAKTPHGDLIDLV